MSFNKIFSRFQKKRIHTEKYIYIYIYIYIYMYMYFCLRAPGHVCITHQSSLNLWKYEECKETCFLFLFFEGPTDFLNDKPTKTILYLKGEGMILKKGNDVQHVLYYEWNVSRFCYIFTSLSLTMTGVLCSRAHVYVNKSIHLSKYKLFKWQLKTIEDCLLNLHVVQHVSFVL